MRWLRTTIAHDIGPSMKVLLIACMLMLSPIVGATTMRPVDLDALARGADAIALVIPRTRTTYADGGRLFTRVEVEVTEVWKGNIEITKTLQVHTLGGVLNGIGQRVAGVPRLVDNERVVLCLKHDANDRWRIDEMWQGAFEVAPDGSVTRPVQSALVSAESLPKTPATLAQLKAKFMAALR